MLPLRLRGVEIGSTWTKWQLSPFPVKPPNIFKLEFTVTRAYYVVSASKIQRFIRAVLRAFSTKWITTHYLQEFAQPTRSKVASGAFQEDGPLEKTLQKKAESMTGQPDYEFLAIFAIL